MYDLIVIGGGPAGASAGITAAKLGARVLLLERGKFPRHKVCGEFVSAESLALLDSLLNSKDSVLNSKRKQILTESIRISKSRVFVDGRRIGIPVNPPAASIARLNLDEALFDSALEAGVDARQQVTVQRISGQNPFEAGTSAGDFQSRAVINATGRWSNLNARTDADVKSKWLGIKGHFKERAVSDSVDLYFFKAGYCGVQPVAMSDGGTRVNACAMVRAGTLSSLDEVFQQHPQLLERSKAWSPISDPVTTFPLFFRAPELVRNGILLAGDSAVFVDPFIGDGISLALRSGAMAAESLASFFRGEKSLLEAADHYRKAYLEGLAPVAEASSVLRRVLQLPRAVRLPMIYFLEKSPKLAAFLVERTR